jgi:hypothetical protein
MSYRERQRLADIQAAIDAIRSHLQRGNLTDRLIFDAVRIRLLEIGEAVKALPDNLLATAVDPVVADHPNARPPRPPLLRHCRPPSTKTCRPRARRPSPEPILPRRRPIRERRSYTSRNAAHT